MSRDLLDKLLLMLRAFALGIFATIVTAVVCAAAIIYGGLVDIAATKVRPFPDRILALASTRAIRHHAPKGHNPMTSDAAALKDGLERYKQACLPCHGGPGAEPEPFAAGMNPPPPDLGSPEIQAFSDGMLYEVTARGIGSTGMPAFERMYAPKDIWSIVAFVRHLSAVTPDEKRRLSPPGGRETQSSTSAPEPRPNGGERVHRVSITNFKYDPPSLQVSRGDVVVWTNNDFVAHTATADDRSFDTGKIEANESKRIVAKNKGTFSYFCRYHNGMRGTLISQ